MKDKYYYRGWEAGFGGEPFSCRPMNVDDVCLAQWGEGWDDGHRKLLDLTDQMERDDNMIEQLDRTQKDA